MLQASSSQRSFYYQCSRWCGASLFLSLLINNYLDILNQTEVPLHITLYLDIQEVLTYQISVMESKGVGSCYTLDLQNLLFLKLKISSIFSDPQPLATTSLLSGTMSLTSLGSISEIIQCLSSYAWLLSLSIMSSRCVHIVANGRLFFFFILE